MIPSLKYTTALLVFTPIGRPKIKACPLRCSTGARLHKEWRDAIQCENDMQESQRILCGTRKYDRHLKKCATCREYEIHRIAERRKIK